LATSKPTDHTASAVFRAAGRPYAAASLLGGLFVGLGVVLMVERASAWPVVAIACAVTAYLLTGLAFLRLEINPHTIRYRTLRGSRVLDFSEIDRAYFETIVNRAAPMGTTRFWIRPKMGKPLSIELRTFRPGAAALLLAAIERHGIPIEAPGAEALRAAHGRHRRRGVF
jgi:hypothetical protein